MAKAFLSHSSSDKDLVRAIASNLGNARCVLDEISFEPGRVTIQEIFRTLDSSDIFVFFISQKSLESPWVKKELAYAHQLLKSDELDRILPIIIEKNITYKSKGIPQWLAKPYNLQYISSPVLIMHQIEKALNEVAIRRALVKRGANLFVGRNEEMKDFETDWGNIENWTPSYIIAHSFYDGMGRRTFLKNALVKTNIVQSPFFPLIINLEARESVESFICRLGMIDKTIHPEQYDFSIMLQKDKIEIARTLLLSFVNNSEIVFFVDPGAVVLPNGRFADWFYEIINSPEFDNKLACCLLSTYRPHNIVNRIVNDRGLCYDIMEFTKGETQTLFMQLLKTYGKPNIKSSDIMLFLDQLSGIPNQIIYAAGMVASDLLYAKQHISEITHYSDKYNSIIAEKIQQENEVHFQILLLLAKNDVLKRDLIYKTFDNLSENNIDGALISFSNYSIISYLYGGFDYIHLSSSLSDYLNRNKYRLKDKYNEKLKKSIKDTLGDNLDEILSQDYSQFLITLQSMIEEHQTIPPRYYIPSFILKGVIREYDYGHYDKVITICEDLLKNRNSDSEILREVTYYLALAYARRQNKKFLNIIESFKDDLSDYYFLYGFYHRNLDSPMSLVKAQQDFEKVLETAPNNKKAKRELVNTLLAQEKYDDALIYAKENYQSDVTNIFHVHSYFQALIRRPDFSLEDKQTIDRLMEQMSERRETKSKDFYKCMQGEYAYYIEHDYEKSMAILKNAQKNNENAEYPVRAMNRINNHLRFH